MELCLCFKPQSSIPKDIISFNYNGLPYIFQHKHLPTTSLQIKYKDPHLLLSNTSLSSETPFHPQFKNTRRTPILASRKNSKRRNTLRISTKAALECAFLIASTFKIVPEPVYQLIKEGFNGGNVNNGGGGLGFWNGLRGGGGWFDGWGGKRKKISVWVLFGFVIVGVLFVVLMLGKDFEGFGEMGLGVLGLVLLWMLERDWKRGAKGWTLGFCSCALMVFLGYKRVELLKLRQRYMVHFPAMSLFRRRTRRRFL